MQVWAHTTPLLMDMSITFFSMWPGLPAIQACMH